jgi:hypothetical protein
MVCLLKGLCFHGGSFHFGSLDCVFLCLFGQLFLRVFFERGE